MKKIIVVGSGASGVHFTLSLLEKGHEVTMLDVGYQKPNMLNPEDNINGLKANLDDTVDYFLGNHFEAFISPDHDAEYYGFPPSKNYVFLKPSQFKTKTSGFAPLFSFAQGGLAEAWTGGVYPLIESELSDFPFSYSDILPYYNKVAERIGISGTWDDLSLFYPYHENISAPLALDRNSELLISKYNKTRLYFNNKLRFYMGRSRTAALSQDKNSRKACNSSGRCLWGCPNQALYTPSLTLEKCKTFKNFSYVPDMYVKYFQYNSIGHINGVVAESLEDGTTHTFEPDKLVLAAGTLPSSRIFLESIFKKTGEIKKLRGLMDNRQILIPFLNLKMSGKPSVHESYQYHQIAMGIKTKEPKEYIHGLVTTLKSALIHPIIKSIPLDLKTSIYFFRNLHSALGLINLNFHDYRRNDNYVTLTFDGDRSTTTLQINYVPINGEGTTINKTLKIVKKAFLKLGCVIPPNMVHIRPMGASVHYSGTIPMSNNCSSFTVSKHCQSHDFQNLYIVDGTTFPFLPAKNLTFTLMANAVRVAENAF
ncbi:GMC oxidoreductase [Thermodesulfobacteriota bacterium]